MTEEQYEWFVQNDAKSELLLPIRQLNHDRDDWDLGAVLDHENPRDSTLTLVEPSVGIYNTSKRDVDETVSKLLSDNDLSILSPKTETQLNLAGNALRDWKANRGANAARKAGTALQSTVSTIGDFLQSFSGVAEIVKGADQQFGGLAYGTIAVLVHVAVQKQRREEAIEEALEELAYAFPRLETLRRIRPKDSLRALIVDVFALVVKFCRETVDYFSQRTRRLTKALSPLKLKTLSSLRVKISEIKEECTIATLEELAETRKTLSKVQEQLRRIETTGDDTNLRVRQGHEWMQISQSQLRDSSLLEIRQALGLKSADDISPSVIISRYKALLEDEFYDNPSEPRSLRQMSWAMLKSEKIFSQWLEHEKSSILLLGGNNFSDSSSVQLNWLSSASVLVAEAINSPTFILSYFCQTDYSNSRSRRRSFPDVIRNLIYQLAEQHPQGLRQQREMIIETFKLSDWDSGDHTTALFAMTDLCIKLLEVFPDGQAGTIVIDRLDQCQWNGSGVGANGLYQAVCALQDIVRHKSLAHLRIKILLVMDGHPAQQIAKLMGTRGRSIDWKVDWDQGDDED